MLDNPQQLQQYQDELRIKKRKTRPFSTCNILPFCSLPPLSIKQAGDNTLRLMHRKEGLIRQMEHNQTYDMPDALRQSAKPLWAYEDWHDLQAFLQRLQTLQSIEGVHIIKHSKYTPYDYLINIYFPLQVTPFNDVFSAEQVMQALTERLILEMAQHGIDEYEISEQLHVPISYSDEDGIILLSWHYQKNIEKDEFEYWPKITGYRADRFGLQINCNLDCVQRIHELQPLSWLAPGKVSQTEFLRMLKTAAEQAGQTFDEQYTVIGTKVHFPERPDDYWENAHKYYVSGHVQAFKGYDWKKYPRSTMTINWQYDLERALQQPYPPQLVLPEQAPATLSH